jgi:hypothetical protein
VRRARRELAVHAREERAALGDEAAQHRVGKACRLGLSAALREYSTWCAAAASSERSRLLTLAGRLNRASSAGTSRRYHRSVPRVMARTAARSGVDSAAASAASADCPPEATASMARAAAASAGAPGAQ